jgi:CRISPR-associated protein Cas1
MPLAVPFARYRIALTLHHAARLHFRHEVMLHSLLSEALGRGELPDAVVPFACESGRVDFEREDVYRFGITVTGRAEENFPKRLQRALETYGGRGFQGDGIPMLRWFSVAEPEALPAPNLEAECAAIAGRELTLQFVSPLILEIPKLDLDGKRTSSHGPRFFDRTSFPADGFLRLLWNRLFFLTEGRFPTREERQGMPPLPELACDPSGLLWIDVPRTSKPSLGGVLGRITLQNPGPGWLPLLAAGQYLHLGKSTGYGFGAYRILGDKSLVDDPFGPSKTALERVCERPRLLAATQHVAESTKAGGTDGIGPNELLRRKEEVVDSTIRAIAAGRYQPAPLLGILLPKPHGKVRALAVPTLTDRSVQRSALAVIGPAIETLLEDCSYAYRKGFSRGGAAQAIEKAYADGYRWVLDADIDSFFDAVPWDRLFAKICALYPFEPLNALLESWVQAPVLFEGTHIARKHGLPQGAVISPLLANLFLDELDEELAGDGFRLVRYADDFVVLCKDLESAELARQRANDALVRLGLSLQEEKTSIRSIDQGFSYLGYLFCRSLSVEEARPQDEPLLAIPLSVPPASWLAEADLARVRELRSGSATPALPRIVPLRPAAAHDADSRRPLYVTDPSLQLHLQDETLAIEKEGEPAKRYPLRALSFVVFIGRPRATLPLILELGLAGVPVFFCRRSGEIEAVHGPFAPDPAAWVAQGKAAADEAMRLAFAQEIVAAKLHNYATLIVRHELQGRDTAPGEIRELERSLWNKTEVDSVRGVEGAAGALYFRCVAATLPAEWGFDGRERRPPGDPFNAMLSYGYTLLYHHCAAALYAAGLLPRIGLFHLGHGAWDALASDLQEELRHVVDGLVWSLIRRREIKPEHFVREDGHCWLEPPARKRFIEAFGERMETSFTPPGGQAMTYREAVGVQAARLRGHILGNGRYEALRTH